MLPAEFHFLRPLWLLALAPLAVLWWQLRRPAPGDHAWQRVCDAHLLPYLLRGHAGRAGRLARLLLGLGWLIAVLALAGPTWSRQPQPVFHKLAARVIVLDLSRSMLAEDLKPSRLSQARFKIVDFLKRAEEGQTGLVAFAGDAFAVSPLTQDADTIAALLPALGPELMPIQGNRTDLGLRKAAELVKQAGFTQGDILLISDSHNGQRALFTARLLAKEGFRISVLAVGSAQGAPIPMAGGGFVKDAFGSLVISRLDSSALRELALAGSGHYIELRTDTADLDWLLTQNAAPFALSAERDQRETTLWHEQGPWLVVVLVPLAALAFRRGWLLAALLVIGALPALPEASAQELRARLDRTTIAQGETVTLSIEANGLKQSTEPDLSPLDKDFQILNNTSSARIEIQGRQQSVNLQWTLQLAPRRSGDLRIPPLKIGAQQTAPLQLLVQAQAVTAGRTEPIFLEVQAQPQAPYVQAQVLYTIRLFYTEPLILEGSLEAPDPADALIERLGDDISYEAIRNGQSYRVVERRYAIFPEKSGALTIPAVAFHGRIRGDDNTRSQFGLFPRMGRRVQIDADPVVLKVRPRPDGYRAEHWLPSAQVTLREEPGQETELRVGEPVTRTLVIEARGLNATQLPALAPKEVPKARVYLDQPLSETHNDGISVFGRREQRVAIIPTEPGELQLPEIRLVWWDTGQDKEQVAVLPARALTILPPADGAAPPAPSVSALQTGPMTKPPLSGLPRLAPPAALWPGISAALLLLWLVTLFAWWRARQTRVVAAVSPAAQASEAESLARRALQRACHANDPRRAAKALLEWSSAHWPKQPPGSLGALAERLSVGAEAVRELDRALYAPGAGAWEGVALWRALKKGLKEKAPATVQAAEPLPPLYPQRSG